MLSVLLWKTLLIVYNTVVLEKAARQREREPYIPLKLGIVDCFVRSVRILRVMISTAINIYLIQIIGNRIEGMRRSGCPDFSHYDAHHVSIQKLSGKEIPAETLQHRPYLLYHITSFALADGKVSL